MKSSKIRDLDKKSVKSTKIREIDKNLHMTSTKSKIHEINEIHKVYGSRNVHKIHEILKKSLNP